MQAWISSNFVETTHWMRNLLLTLLFACSIAVSLHSQAVPNPSFELWESDTTVRLNGWFDSNTWSQIIFGRPNVTPSNDAHGGNFGARLETIVPGNDTLYGYVTNTNGDPINGEGGIPYAQQPDTLHIWVKHDILAGDTAAMVVVFKAAGVVLSTDFHVFTGTVSTYTKVDIPLTLASMPDSVIFAMVSSFPDHHIATDGSWLLIDDMSFNTSQPIPNGDFESWTTSVTHEPTGWTSPDMYGDSLEVVTRTTDAITGMYAAQVETQAIFGGQDTLGYMTTGVFSGGNQAGGQPYTNTIDTLCGYYKYTGVANDSAVIGAVFFQAGMLFSVAAVNIHDQATYTYFEIPFQLGMTPDTVRIDIWSSHPNGVPMPGSILIVDSLRFKSDPLVGIPHSGPKVVWQLFPNPTAGDMWMEAALNTTGKYRLSVMNLAGQEAFVADLDLEAGVNRIKMDFSALSPGAYIARLTGNGHNSWAKIVVQ